MNRVSSSSSLGITCDIGGKLVGFFLLFMFLGYSLMPFGVMCAGSSTLVCIMVLVLVQFFTLGSGVTSCLNNILTLGTGHCHEV